MLRNAQSWLSGASPGQRTGVLVHFHFAHPLPLSINSARALIAHISGVFRRGRLVGRLAISSSAYWRLQIGISLLAVLGWNAASAPAWAADPETEVSKVLGNSLADTFAAQSGEVNDPLLLQWVQRMGAQISAVAPRQNIHYHYAILDSAEPNAFTLPGGYIFVTRGLLDFVANRDELAGVMAHETGHATAEHPMHIIEWELGSAIALRYGPLPRSQLATVLEQGGVFLATLQFSRKDELQADQYGIRFATEVGYDPEGLVNFLQGLGVEKHSSFLDRYLATHPPNVDRIHALQRTSYLAPGNWQFQESEGDRFLVSCRPALALRYYARAQQNHAGDPDLEERVRKAQAALGGSRTPAPTVPPAATVPPAPITPPAPNASPAPNAPPAPTASPAPNAPPAPTAPPVPNTPPAPTTPSSNAAPIGDGAPAPTGASGTQTGPASSGSEPGFVPVPSTDARAALAKIQPDVVSRSERVIRTLRSLSKLQRLNVTLRDGLLGAAPIRLDDWRWLVLAYQAYADADRLNDLFATLVRVDVRLPGVVSGMQQEVLANLPAGDASSAAIRLAPEMEEATEKLTAATGHTERAMVLLAAVLGDLDSVLVGFNARVNNIRLATVEAALLAAKKELDTGRHLAEQSLDLLSLSEDRLLLVQINRMGAEADDHRLEIFDCNTAQLLGLTPDKVRAVRADGSRYGDAVVTLALGEELRATIEQVQQRHDRWLGLLARQFREQPVPKAATPVSWVDAAMEQGGSSLTIEIMLRQIAAAMFEEVHGG